MALTQEGLAKRAGLPLPTYRKFEQKGLISLQGFVKILAALGALEDLSKILKENKTNYTSIDDVLTDTQKRRPKRGKIK